MFGLLVSQGLHVFPLLLHVSKLSFLCKLTQQSQIWDFCVCFLVSLAVELPIDSQFRQLITKLNQCKILILHLILVYQDLTNPEKYSNLQS